MILRFCSGSVTPASRVEEQVGGVDEVERQLQLLAEALLDLVGLVVAQQPVVDEDARQPVADGAVDQHRRDGRIDAARQAADDLAGVPTCAPDPLGRFLDERRDRPVAACSRRRRRRSSAGSRGRGRCARLRGGTAARRAPRSGASIAAIGAVALVAATLKSRRHRRHVVAVARPDPQLVGHAGEQARRAPPLPPTCTCAWPNSRCPERRTSPPSTSVISCMP